MKRLPGQMVSSLRRSRTTRFSYTVEQRFGYHPEIADLNQQVPGRLADLQQRLDRRLRLGADQETHNGRGALEKDLRRGRADLHRPFR